MKNILLINPIATDKWNESDKEYLIEYVNEDTNLDVVSIKEGPKTIECTEDEIKSIPGTLEIIKKNKGKYDGFIINCFLGPGVKEAKSIVDVPVIGPGEVSFHVASLLYNKFGVISPRRETGDIVGEMVSNAGLDKKFAGVVELNLGVDDLLKEPEKTRERIIFASRKLIDDMNAEVIIFGCTGLVNFAEEIRSVLDVPLIEPVITSLKMTETLVSLGLS